METIQWSDDLSVGIKQFDDEHKELIKFINRLNEALVLKSTGKDVEEILDGLIRYTVIHFGHEEDLMKKHIYPDYPTHKKEHVSLTSQVLEFYERFRAGKVKFSLALMIFLRDWVMNHIKTSDMKYGTFFNSKGIG